VEIPQRQPHAFKLTHATEFRAALAAECRLSSKSFLLRAGANSLPGARLGLIASRKAARRAVDRNRGKRLAREAFRAARLGHQTFPAGLPAVDVVLQLKNNLRETGNAELRKELDRLLREMAARYGQALGPSTA
jgi:ribonuclease P protein component